MQCISHVFICFCPQSTKKPDILYFIEKKGKKGFQDIGSKFSYLEIRDGFDRVRRGQYAFHCDEQTAFPVVYEKFDSHEMCDLNLLQFRPTQFLALVLRKESPFRSITATK